MAADEDLKLSDLLRYYQRDATAVKALLYRRLRLLADLEQTTRALQRARARNRDVHAVSGPTGDCDSRPLALQTHSATGSGYMCLCAHLSRVRSCLSVYEGCDMCGQCETCDLCDIGLYVTHGLLWSLWPVCDLCDPCGRYVTRVAGM